MICLPKGKQVTGMSLMLATASGIPMMVMACAAAVVMWPMASQSPATRNQMMLLIPLMAPAPGAGTTSRPKGHRT